MELLHAITKATPLDDMKIRVEFDGGDVVGGYDCAPLTKDAYWSRLASPEFFMTARAEYGTIVWNDSVDAAPESVWEDSRNTPCGGNGKGAC